MGKIDAKEFLAIHCIATLPDSISARKRILAAIIRSLAKNNPTRISAQLMLRHILHQESEQMKFQQVLIKGGVK
jgi:hypothetical protein